MPSIGIALIVTGVGLTIVAQLLMAISAFAKNPPAGVMCLFVPMYIVVHAKKSSTGKNLLKAWWLGLGLLLAGGILAS